MSCWNRIDLASTRSKLFPSRRLRPRSVRWAKIAAIRKAIARGTYDTEDKWEKMLARLLRDL